MSHAALPSSPVYQSLLNPDRSQRTKFYSLQDAPFFKFKTKSQQVIRLAAPSHNGHRSPSFTDFRLLMKIASGNPEMSS